MEWKLGWERETGTLELRIALHRYSAYNYVNAMLTLR